LEVISDSSISAFCVIAFCVKALLRFGVRALLRFGVRALLRYGVIAFCVLALER